MKEKIQKDKVFFTSDHHFGHHNIIEYSKRPFSNVREMDEVMIKAWNEVVPQDGVVFHHGDYSFNENHQNYTRRLNGQIIFIQGNHDRGSYSFGTRHASTGGTYFPGLFDDSETQPFDASKAINRPRVSAFLEWRHGYFSKDPKHLLVMSHYCMLNYNKAHRGAWMTFGHSHGSLNQFLEIHVPHLLALDVGVDSVAKITGSYRPISFGEVEKILTQRARKHPFRHIDHHGQEN